MCSRPLVGKKKWFALLEEWRNQLIVIQKGRKID